MKTIGLIGGMSWESSLEYYRIINEVVKHRLGGTHSARSIMYSVNFEEIEKLQNSGDWDRLTTIMTDAALSLEKAGADIIVICTNTMHKAADKIQEKVSIPMLHIVDPTAKRIKSVGISKIGLLGTKFTMEQDFFKGRLIEKHGLEIILPDENERKVIHDIIYSELVLGEIKEESREKFKLIISNLKRKGAEGVILGCTEIGLLIKKEDVEIPIFDTTELHAIAAVDFAL
ncbi:MAG: putative amino-acid racemase [Candidatus Heimdallarchaeota archaeon LC_2]|nr:MAG: putative amino-acid racemase [Candidatus Heimdallarchaeota archaeon LC_2]